MCETVRKENIGKTEVYITQDADQVKEKIADYVEGGLVAILYDMKLKEYADSLARCFRGGNHMVFSTCIQGEIPAHTRFIIGVGAGTVSALTRQKATELNVECALVFSAPTTDTILTENQHKNHKAVFIDEGLVGSCPKECIASGWGIVLAEPLAIFEDYYSEKILDENCFERRTKCLPCENDNVNLALCLLGMSGVKVRKDNATVMAEVLYHTLRAKGGVTRLMGEYRFISASVISALYESYLSSPSLDCAIPPAHDLNMDVLAKLVGKPMDKLLKQFDFLSIDGYFRVGYILSEYRLDLLDKLRMVDFHSAQKRWRRIYPDAGYWLKSAFTTNSLLTAMKLSAEVGHGLLRYICESGFAEAC